MVSSSTRLTPAGRPARQAPFQFCAWVSSSMHNTVVTLLAPWVESGTAPLMKLPQESVRGPAVSAFPVTNTRRRLLLVCLPV